MGDIAPIQAKSILESLAVGGDIPYCSLRDLSSACYYAGGSVGSGNSPTVKSGYESIHGLGIPVKWMMAG